MLEIERKFLVNGNFKSFSIHHEQIIQGYLSADPKRTVRIRKIGSKAFLTIKGMGDKTGMSRFEWEKEIGTEDAEQLMRICIPGTIIDKTRYYIKSGEFTFEVDEFHKENRGLIIAEIELHKEDDAFEKPVWLGKEVTGDIRFYNSYLSQHPYSTW